MNNNIMAMFQNFMNNPMGYLMQGRMNIPQGMNDPNAIIQQLLNSGQINQQAYNQAQQIARQLQNRR